LRTLGRTADDQRRRQVVTLGHVPALDGLRAVAIILVLAFHAGHLLPGGWLGVDLFFVLSGFLITGLLLSEWSRFDAVSLGSFYRRRALRLLPALFVMIGAYMLVVLAWSARGYGSGKLVPNAAKSALLGATYTTNIANAFLGSTPDPGLNHLWSLAIEEQFYLVWPPLLFLFLRRSIKPAVIAFGLVLVTLASIAATPWLTHVDSVLIGCLAGVVFCHDLARVPRWVAWAALAVCVPLVLLAYDTAHSQPWPLPVFTVAAALVLLVAARDEMWLPARALSLRPLRTCGRISYGIYLWHVPCFVALGWVIGLPLAILLALASYRYVERPFLRRKRRGSQSARREPGRVAIPASAPAPV
jgi:peptidoglycan/LPS O-acetylase OafA/YrhL